MKINIMKNVLKKINVLGLVALFFAGGMALAFTPKTIELAPNEVMWGQTSDEGWVKLETPEQQDADCESHPQICKAIYADGFDPNDDLEEGLIRNLDDEGYVEL